jgi:hypothetical protein
MARAHYFFELFFFKPLFFDADLMIVVVETGGLVRGNAAPACLIAALKSARISA